MSLSNFDKAEKFSYILASDHKLELEIVYERGQGNATAYPTKCKISYNSVNLDKWAGRGYWEYPTVRYIWQKTGYWKRNALIPGMKNMSKPSHYYCPDMKGDISVWALTLHEFAHIIVGAKEGHNFVFQSELLRLIKKYPYRETFWEKQRESWERFLSF